jgi:hypothetical protein
MKIKDVEKSLYVLCTALGVASLAGLTTHDSGLTFATAQLLEVDAYTALWTFIGALLGGVVARVLDMMSK